MIHTPFNVFHLNIPNFVVHIIDRLRRAGYKSYLVGGALRDACLNRPVTDWDVATPASLEEILGVFSNLKTFTLKHGTVTVVKQGKHYEVTSFRGKSKSLKEDLSHRDFTIDAMAYDPLNGSLWDPFRGRNDIEEKLLRTVGKAEDRFLEDPIRLLRAVRISLELNFDIEEGTAQSMRSQAFLLKSAASERIRDEIVKILQSPRPSKGFHVLLRAGLLPQFLPELAEGYRKRQNAYHDHTIFKHILLTVDLIPPKPHLRLAALFHDIAKPRVRKKALGQWQFHAHEEASARLCKEIMTRLRFSRAMIEQVSTLVRHHMIDYRPDWRDGAVRRLIQRAGAENVADLLALRRADILAHGLHKSNLTLFEELEDRIQHLGSDAPPANVRDLAVSGQTVMQILRIPPGPEVGKILESLLEVVTDQPGLNTQEALIHILKGMKKE
jgi:poly(A) polymerase/tRNA nucleotidyltransferase (CCA-adding enzyme)